GGLARAATTASSARPPSTRRSPWRGRGRSRRRAMLGSPRLAWRQRPDRPSVSGVRSSLAQEALEFTGERVPGGHLLGGVLLFALGGLLQPFDERLDFGVALNGDPDLAREVGRGRLELGVVA